jgi:hypothetical protein
MRRPSPLLVPARVRCGLAAAVTVLAAGLLGGCGGDVTTAAPAPKAAKRIRRSTDRSCSALARGDVVKALRARRLRIGALGGRCVYHARGRILEVRVATVHAARLAATRADMLGRPGYRPCTPHSCFSGKGYLGRVSTSTPAGSRGARAVAGILKGDTTIRIVLTDRDKPTGLLEKVAVHLGRLAARRVQVGSVAPGGA